MLFLSGSRIDYFAPQPGICLGILLCLAPGILAHASCTAPPDLNSRVQSQPTAEAFAKIGKWFGDQLQFNCAAEAFANAVRLQPASGELAYMWGLSLYSAGETQASLGPLQDAARLDRQDIRSHLVRGTALDKLSRTTDAEREWRAALAIDSSSAMALDGLSRDLLNDKDYDATITLLEQRSHRGVRTPQQSFNLGMAYAKTLQLKEAFDVLSEGVNSSPDSLSLGDELAVVLMLLGRPDEAETVLANVFNHHPGDLKTQILYFRVLVSNQSEKAKDLGQKLLTVAARNWEVLYLNAQVEAREEDFQQARVHLEQSIALNPDYFQSREALGVVLTKLHQLSSAKESLEKAVSLGDSGPAVQYELAKVLEGLGEAGKAQEKMRLYQTMRKAEADQTLAVGKIEAADLALSAGDPAQAIALYREALSLDPNEARLAYKLAMALDKTKDFAAEQTALQRAIELNPKIPEAQNQMGYLAGKSGDLARAESCYRAAVNASPSYLRGWVNLAATFADEAKWQDAKQALAHARELDPDSADVRRLDQAISAAQANP
jgi:tetratricopeptide (TPR) repeat protein